MSGSLTKLNISELVILNAGQSCCNLGVNNHEKFSLAKSMFDLTPILKTEIMYIAKGCTFQKIQVQPR